MMETLEKFFVEKLSAVDSIKNAVGTGIFFAEQPQGKEAPFVTWFFVSGAPKLFTTIGASKLKDYEIQLSIFSGDKGLNSRMAKDAVKALTTIKNFPYGLIEFCKVIQPPLYGYESDTRLFSAKIRLKFEINQ